MLATHDRITIIKENLQWGFSRLPRPVLKAKGLSFRSKCLYALLLDYCRDQDFCYPSQETLANDLDTSVDTIQRGLQELRDYGLITWQQDGYRKTNVYFVVHLTESSLLGLEQQMPQQKPHSCADKPHFCAGEPHPCGTNSKSKHTQESDEDSSKIPEKEGVSHSHSLQATRKQEKNPLPTIGKPITQEDINAKKKHGLNVSGLTPLSHIIPPQHWQELEAKARKEPVKPSATHFNTCTKNAPMVIDATLEQFTSMLGDEPENTAININRAAKLYRKTGIAQETFREKLYEAFDQARRYPSASILKKRKDGRPNRMPVFFAILQERVAEL